MSSPNLVVSFLVKLVNQVTAPAKQVAGAVAGMAKTATDAVKPVKAVGKALDEVKAPAVAAAESAKAAGDALQETVKPAEDAGEAVEDAGKKAEGAGKRFGWLGGAVRVAAQGLLAVDAVIIAHKALIGAAIAGAVLFTNSQARLAEADARAAKAAGVTYETYQKLRYAYRTSSLDVSLLDGSLKGLIHSYGQALTGSKQQIAAFSTLGVKLRDAKGHTRSVEDLFGAIADGMAKRADGHGKSYLASTIFGDNGPAILTLFDKGSAGIKELTDRAVALNQVIGDKSLADAEAFTGAWNHITDTLVGVKNSIWTGLLPSMTQLITKIGDIIDQNREDILKALKSGIDWLTKNMPAILKGLGQFVGFLKDVIKFGAGVINALGGMTTALSLCAVVLAANVVVAVIGAVSAIASFALAVWAAIPAVAAFTVALLANPLTWIVLGIVAVIAALVWMAFHWKLVTKTVSEFWDWMKDHFPFLTSFVQPFIDIAGLLITHWREIPKFFIGLWNWMNAHHAWGAFIQPLIDTAQLIISHWSEVTSFFQGFWKGISDVFGKIAGAWNGLPAPLRGFLAGAAATVIPGGGIFGPDLVHNAIRGGAIGGSVNGAIDVHVFDRRIAANARSATPGVDFNTAYPLGLGLQGGF